MQLFISLKHMTLRYLRHANLSRNLLIHLNQQTTNPEKGWGFAKIYLVVLGCDNTISRERVFITTLFMYYNNYVLETKNQQTTNLKGHVFSLQNNFKLTKYLFSSWRSMLQRSNKVVQSYVNQPRQKKISKMQQF